MHVTVQYFARLRELAGCQTWICELTEGSTVADVWQACISRHPRVEVLGASLSCAVNADFSRMGAIVRDGDEVAFLPPVSGGAWTES